MKLGNLPLIMLTKGEYTAVISPKTGGALISLQKNGVEALNVPQSEEALKASLTAYGFPILFPPNRINAGTFTVEGKTYHFPINEPARGNSLHGFLHYQEWKVEKQSLSSVTLSFEGNDQTEFYQFFPVLFKVERCYELDEDGIKETVTVMNQGKEALPVGLGYHTALKLEEGSKVRVSVGKRIEMSERMLPTGEVRELNDQEIPFRYQGQSGTAWSMDDHYTVETMEADGKLFHGAQIICDDHVTEYEVSPFFRHWMIWNNQQNGKFICIEPQNWRVNAPNLTDELGSEAGMDVLHEGESLTAWTHLRIK